MEKVYTLLNEDKFMDKIVDDYDLSNLDVHLIRKYLDECKNDSAYAHYIFDEEKRVWRCSNCGAALPDGIDEDNMPFIIEDVRYCYRCGRPIAEDVKIPYHFIMNWLEDLDTSDYGISGMVDSYKKTLIKMATDMMEDYKKVENGKV